MEKVHSSLTLANVEHAVCVALVIHASSSFMKADKRKLWKTVFTTAVDTFAAIVPGV